MRWSVAVVLALSLGSAAWAEMRDEEHLVGDRIVRITGFDTFEIMTVGPPEHEQIQVLSGGDVELLPIAGAEGSAALIGPPVLVAEVTGTHSCEEGDARAYFVVTLGDVPMPEGPLTTCEAMEASVGASGQVLLQGRSEAWAWVPGKGWAVSAN